MDESGARVKLLIGTPLEAEHVARIRAVDPRLDVVYRPDLLGTPRYPADHHPPSGRDAAREAEFRALLAQAEILFDFDQATAPHLPDLAPRLRWIQTTSAGVGQAVARYGLDRTAVIVTTSSGIHAGPLAEFVALAMLMFTKRAFYLLEAKERREFRRFATGELAGRTLALIGPGNVGRRVARLARAFGLTVTALGRHRRAPEELGVDRVYARADLLAMLAEADFVVLAAPHTPETEGLIGAAELAVMKPTAVLINVARGALVDEDALADALGAGRLAGAALDVFRQEPLPPESPLWTLPNVLLNPHSASTAESENGKITDLFCANLRYYLAGHPEQMRNILDKSRLY
ncbi:MAG TPA: D-2-hydroxyacid dehydrogenase [Thermomicrobiales bacterium]|nr:D-2-hydroxyacid dehydrogenase [Thermomicrobiales bacterium]